MKKITYLLENKFKKNSKSSIKMMFKNLWIKPIVVKKKQSKL
jgi:hypothetical protein